MRDLGGERALADLSRALQNDNGRVLQRLLNPRRKVAFE